MQFLILLAGLISAPLALLVAALPAPDPLPGALSSRSLNETEVLLGPPPISSPSGIDAITNLLNGLAIVETDRGSFTRAVIDQAQQRWKHVNWMICHSKHDYGFDGNEFDDWAHYRKEFPVSSGRTIGYDLYWFKSGWFTRHEDGGFQNWAYDGNILEEKARGSSITVFFGVI